MTRTFTGTLSALLIISLSMLASCKSAEKEIKISRIRVEMDERWDRPNEKAGEAFAPYKAAIDSMMSPIIGTSAVEMIVARPESPLSNIVADMLRESTKPYIGTAADMGLVNIGGLRANLSAGEITYGSVYEILPFQNSLCILTLKGKDLLDLAEDIAKAGGEGVSNMQIVADKNHEVIHATIGGRAIDKDKNYTVATIDYLAEGNDKMVSLLKAERKQCFPEATIRSLFVEYIQAQTAKHKPITAKIENRMVFRNE